MLSRQFSDDLADLARASERKRDAALLRATTELFVLDVVHDRDEIRRYEELATHFLSKVTIEDRRFVSERLASCADAPQSIVRQLARDVIDVAAPVIERSPVLGPIDLLSVIAAAGVEHHRLIAKRPALSAEVVRALRLTGDLAVLTSLEARDAPIATPKETAIDASAANAAGHGPRTVNRYDPWQFIGLDRRARLHLIADLASRPPLRHASDATRLDRAFRSILSAAQIVGFARSGQLPAIIGAIAEGLGLQRALVAAAVHDASGELLAIMLKALRLDDIQARQVFLLASPAGHDVKHFFPLSDLFAGMEPSVAETLVAAWREAGLLSTSHHESHLVENGEARRRSVSEPARQATQTPDEQARRA